MYSLEGEDDIVLKYFTDKYGENFKGSVLEIGANDGIIYSNSRLFIEKGWKADLVEPAEVPFKKLAELYPDHPDVKIHNFAIDKIVGTVTLHESGMTYNIGPTETGMLSSLIAPDLAVMRMLGIFFRQMQVKAIDFKTLLPLTHGKWNFISIDTEGKDWDILEQINLRDVGCEVLCIEHKNATPKEFYIEYARRYGGLKVLLINEHNILFTKQDE